MKRVSCFVGVVSLCLMMALCIVISAGCDEANGISGIGLSVVPSSVTYSRIVPSPSNPDAWPLAEPAQFTALWNTTNGSPGTSYELALPLEWSVSDPSQGSIAGTSGDFYHGGATALYVPTGKEGQNVVTVRDQYGNEGFALVTTLPGTTAPTNSP